jgi:prepilin-type processing-associated H-X9-DG protein
MLSTFFNRSFSIVLATLTILGVSAVQAQDLKPFLTLQIGSPSTLIGIAEQVIGIVIDDPADSSKTKAQLAQFKNMPGVNNAGTFGIALMENEASPFGIDAAIFLPIRDFKTFNIPGMEDGINMMRAMAQQNGTNKYTIASPAGNVVGYQKTGYFVLATETADAFANTADPKKVFAEVEKFTLGVHVNLDNISFETVEKGFGQAIILAAMTGVEPDAMGDTDSVLDNLANLFDDIVTSTMGVTLNARTLELTASTQVTPRPGSQWAEKVSKTKNVQTKLGAFVPDTPQIVTAGHYYNYLIDREINNINEFMKLVPSALMEGFLESMEGEEEAEKFQKAAELLLGYAAEVVNLITEERLIDATYSLDTDGTLIMAMATKDTKKAVELDEQLFGSLLEEFIGKEGKEFIEGKIKRDYETIAGYSLSSLPNILANLPPDIDLPEEIKSMPLGVLWAVKDREAVVFALGLDFDKAEKTLKDALAKTATPIQPKQTFVFGLKPFGTFMQTQFLPLIEKFGVSETDIVQAKEVFTKLAALDASAKIVGTTEFPGNSILNKLQVDGKFSTAYFQVMLAPAINAAREAARRMQCSTNIMRITMALHTYHDANNAFPPLYTVGSSDSSDDSSSDSGNRPLHSWRVLILPYIEQQALYDRIRLDEPWDSPFNRQFHNAMIPLYACPSGTPRMNAGRMEYCTYSVIAGEGFKPATGAGTKTGVGIGAISDGTSNTIAIVEVGVPFCWMDPRADVDLAMLARGINRPGGRVGSAHAGGMNVGFFDGAVRFIPQTVEATILRAFGTIAGGEIETLP